MGRDAGSENINFISLLVIIYRQTQPYFKKLTLSVLCTAFMWLSSIASQGVFVASNIMIIFLVK